MNPRKRFEILARAPEDKPILAEAALWIAAEEYPDLDVPAWLRRLDETGRAAARRITPATGLDDTAAALARILAEEQGFRGNTDDYYDPRNSFLNDVLDRRLGIPITLSVVYMEVATRAGVTVQGIGLPGHFIIRLERRDGTRLLDPFNGGRVLGEADCRRLLRQTHGAEGELHPRHLRPVTTREILTRILNNLKGIYLSLGDWPRALGAVDRMLLLAPEALGEVRDRGLLHAKLGQADEAIHDWEAYITRAPDAPDVGRVREHLRALRQARAVLN